VDGTAACGTGHGSASSGLRCDETVTCDIVDRMRCADTRYIEEEEFV